MGRLRLDASARPMRSAIRRTFHAADPFLRVARVRGAHPPREAAKSVRCTSAGHGSSLVGWSDLGRQWRPPYSANETGRPVSRNAALVHPAAGVAPAGDAKAEGMRGNAARAGQSAHAAATQAAGTGRAGGADAPRPERARGTMLAQTRGCPGRCRSLRRTSPALAAPSASEQRPRRRHPRPGLERVVQDDRSSCARRCEPARRVDDRRGRPDRRRVHELPVGDNDEVHFRADEDSGALLGDVRAAEVHARRARRPEPRQSCMGASKLSTWSIRHAWAPLRPCPATRSDISGCRQPFRRSAAARDAEGRGGPQALSQPQRDRGAARCGGRCLSPTDRRPSSRACASASCSF
jgi:hypothetical protein